MVIKLKFKMINKNKWRIKKNKLTKNYSIKINNNKLIVKIIQEIKSVIVGQNTNIKIVAWVKI